MQSGIPVIFGVLTTDTVEQAIDRAGAKGSRDSLILMNDLAMIVNIRNRTVITAMEGKDIKENIFTNIDSAIIP